MPFKPLVELDPIKLENASRNLCAIFGVPSLHSYQVETGQNTLKGISTFLDIPTGGGRPMLFVGPLTALLESQAADLTERGVPAIAISSTSEDPDKLLGSVAENKYRVAFISPEMAVSPKFHGTVLSSDLFADNLISLVIDESHCISDWGNDDFRPEYSNLHILLGRIPSGVPVVAASATMPEDVIADIRKKLRLPAHCPHIAVSNEKKNIALSVRIIQHPLLDTLADLITLFPHDATGPEDFVQTLIYAGERVTTEKIQDFLRSNSPDTIPEEVFEFYHRHIDEARKKFIQEGIMNGTLRGIAATDALGMGINFMRVLRVILWLCPRSFLSLVQKIGRCARAAELLGEAILYITNAAYMQYKIELDILKGDLSDNNEEDDGASEQQDPAVEGERMDRDAAVENDETEQEKAPRPKGKKALTVLQARDRRYLLEYIVTTGCRRIPWNKFFGNNSKLSLPHPAPPGARCCDNCTPELFPVETVRLAEVGQAKSGRRKKNETNEEVAAAVSETLLALRDMIVERKFPGQHIITGKILMSDLVVDALANRARAITSLDALKQAVNWVWASELGAEVVEAIQVRLLDFPDLERLAREERARGKGARST
ncbi:p-loop containing nucleoside triphosphate hydrolase protein [Mycena sanguinolenta]|uniref:DNA 3'-5' helicase n=1 Tax=Mycena sanguinolenta TaxID=230812 RepID=A0A8H6XXN4_9AGAR|nr:p-loop containing nucleoside triphosphate hydrolase protein [Mycena sanguinolenta]